jgi:hypothetical protein
MSNVQAFEKLENAASYKGEGVGRAVRLLKRYAPWFEAQGDGLATVVTNPLSTTVTAVETGAGNLYAVFVISPAAATQDAYVQMFNTASGSVTLGTTDPIDVIACPAGKVRVAMFVPGDDDDDLYSSAISHAATTTFDGNTALGAASQPEVWVLSA